MYSNFSTRSNERNIFVIIESLVNCECSGLITVISKGHLINKSGHQTVVTFLSMKTKDRKPVIPERSSIYSSSAISLLQLSPASRAKACNRTPSRDLLTFN